MGMEKVRDAGGSDRARLAVSLFSVIMQSYIFYLFQVFLFYPYRYQSVDIYVYIKNRHNLDKRCKVLRFTGAAGQILAINK